MKPIYLQTIEDVHILANTTESQPNNWWSRFEILHGYQSNGTGRANKKTCGYIGALEIAFMAALVSLGLRPSVAAAYASSFATSSYNHDVKNVGHPLPEFLVFGMGKYETARSFNSGDDIQKIRKHFGLDWPLSFLPLQEIKNRVDAYFAEHGI